MSSSKTSKVSHIILFYISIKWSVTVCAFEGSNSAIIVCLPSEKGSTLKQEDLLHKGSNSVLLE